MRSNKKRFAYSWALGISLGLVGSAGVVLAGVITDTYTTGDTLTAAKMDAIKAAVNDNDTRINNLVGNSSGVGAACVGNNTSDEMVRIGPLCVDKHRASLWSSNAVGATAVAAIPGGCNADGSGCSSIFAQSRATPGSAKSSAMSWSQAQIACANAGKRLLKLEEWHMASITGTALGINTLDEDEYIHLLRFDGSNVLTGAAYIGPVTSIGVQYFFTNLSSPNTTATWLYFRCAR